MRLTGWTKRNEGDCCLFELEITNKFKKSYKNFHKNEQKAVNDAIKLLAAAPPFQPSLRTKRIEGTKSIFEASANMDIRISWEYSQTAEQTLILRNCGHHDDLLRNP